MKRIIKMFVSMMLIVGVLFSGSSVFAATTSNKKGWNNKEF